jgi:hypothetical protein
MFMKNSANNHYVKQLVKDGFLPVELAAKLPVNSALTDAYPFIRNLLTKGIISAKQAVKITTDSELCQVKNYKRILTGQCAVDSFLAEAIPKQLTAKQITAVALHASHRIVNAGIGNYSDHGNRFFALSGSTNMRDSDAVLRATSRG